MSQIHVKQSNEHAPAAAKNNTKLPLAEALQLVRPHERASYEVLSKPGAKHRVFASASGSMTHLVNPQSWISVLSPDLAFEAARELKKIEKPGKIYEVFNGMTGLRVPELTDAQLVFYVDELMDAIDKALLCGTKITDALAKLLDLANASVTNGIRLRYGRRATTDLALEDELGGCTARGSENFGGSLTWRSNPYYNVVHIHRVEKNRFLGEITIALGSILGHDVVIVDSSEVVPHARFGQRYYDLAIQALKVAIDFAKSLSVRQERSLLFYGYSNFKDGDGNPVIKSLLNQEGAKNVFEITGLQTIPICLLIPVSDVVSVLSSTGYAGNPDFYYQVRAQGTSTYVAPQSCDSMVVNCDVGTEHLYLLKAA